MRATFEVQSVSETEGRGVLVAGRLLSGTVKKGSRLSSPGALDGLVVREVKYVHGGREWDDLSTMELRLPIYDEAGQAQFSKRVAGGQCLEFRHFSLPREWLLPTMVAFAVLNAAAVLLYGFDAPLTGFGLGLVEVLILDQMEVRRLMLDPLLATVLNVGLGALVIVAYCAIWANVLCGRNPILLTITPVVLLSAAFVRDVAYRVIGSREMGW